MVKRALDKIKVVDFTQVVAGHRTTKILADCGATVVMIENIKSVVGRAVGPYQDGKSSPNRCTPFAYDNVNKYSISLDLDHPQGIEVAKRLISWADVVVENFRPGVMERWGLGYEDLKKIKPDIIMLRLSAQGQTGPFSRSKSFGQHLSGLFSIAHFIGWLDREPISPMFAYSDYFVPLFAIAVLAGAMDYRRRTGKGTAWRDDDDHTGRFLTGSNLDRRPERRVGAWNSGGRRVARVNR